MADVIRVLIVEDHPATAAGLGELLGREPDIQVVGSARSVDQARQVIASAEPDVVLCDVELDGSSRGFELLNGTAGPQFAVVMLSAFNYHAYYQLAWERGAAGYLLKTEPVAEVLRAIRRAAKGGRTFDVTGGTRASTVARRPSMRECDVLALLANGRSNDEIGRELNITVRTAESHLRRMFARYSVVSRTELAMLAVREGWVPLPRRAE